VVSEVEVTEELTDYMELNQAVAVNYVNQDVLFPFEAAERPRPAKLAAAD